MTRCTVRSLDDVLAAVDAESAGAPVRVISAPGAAASLGAQAFVEMIRAAREVRPDVVIDAVLDCADAPGLALNALRCGAEAVRLNAPEEVLEKVRAVAAESGARIETSDETGARIEP
ncbi:MAG: hypothetical protein ACYYKD_07425 [Rhodospirillales bacterium]